MATLQQAIDIAKTEPNSERSKKLLNGIVTGKFDAIAKSEGVDIGYIKRKVSPVAESLSYAASFVPEAMKKAEELKAQDYTSTEKVTMGQMKSIGMPEEQIQQKIMEARAEEGAPVKGFAERFAEGTAKAAKEQLETAGETQQAYKEGKIGLGQAALETIQEGFLFGTSPVSGLYEAAEPVIKPIGGAAKTAAEYIDELGQNVTDFYQPIIGTERIQKLQKETIDPALENAKKEYDEFYNNLTEDQKRYFKIGSNTVLRLLDFVGGGAVKKGVEGIAPKIIEPAIEATGKFIDKGYQPLKESINKSISEFKIARQAKGSAEAAIKAEKLATEILQPSKNDIKLAKMAGNNTSDAVKEFVKVAEVSNNFDEALEKLAKSTSEDFAKRNEMLSKNNFTIDPNRPTKELTEYLAKIEEKGLATEAELNSMREVLAKESEWLRKNAPDRLKAQARKEDMYIEAKPLYKKQGLGTATENEAGRIKAFELLGQGYKNVVENGDPLIKAMNATYGGKLGAMEMLASRGALAEKAISQTVLQKLAAPVVNLLSASTGAGSAQFVARLAANQQAKLSSLLKKLVKLREKAGIERVEITQSDLDDIIKLLPAPSGEQSAKEVAMKAILLPQRTESTVEAVESALRKPYQQNAKTKSPVNMKGKPKQKTNANNANEKFHEDSIRQNKEKVNAETYYHGTPEKFDKFKENKGFGTFFTTDKTYASKYANKGEVIETNLNVKNPYTPNAAEQTFLRKSTGNELIRWQKDIASKARKLGHDSIIYDGGETVAVLDNSVIKPFKSAGEPGTQGTAKVKTLYHGTSAPEFKEFKGTTYLTDDPLEAKGFAEGIHLGGGKGGKTRVLEVSAPMKRIKNIDEEMINGIMDEGLTDNEIIAREMLKAKEEGYDTLSFTHPSTYNEGEFTVYVPIENSSVKILPKANMVIEGFKDSAKKPPCVVEFMKVLDKNPEAQPIRGIRAVSLEKAKQVYADNIKAGHQKVLDGFTHVVADVNGKIIDNGPKPSGSQFFTEEEILSN